MKEVIHFNFKDLKGWQKAINFADHIIRIAENPTTERKYFRPLEQLDSSSVSIAQNIAEGKGRYSKKEYIRFLYLARGLA